MPSKYGGFETLVENLVSSLSNKYHITVVCSSRTNDKKLKKYKNASLKYVPLKANGWQSIIFDIISILISIRKHDKILILGASGCLILPILYFYKHKFIFLFGGLDWKRSKWNYIAKKILKISEGIGLRYSKYLISDNVGIQNYIKKKYKLDSHLIEYGGDQAFRVNVNQKFIKKYPFLKSNYFLCVARIQRDNNIQMIIDAFDDSFKNPLVIVGNWNFSSYGKKLKEKYKNRKNLILLDAIYTPSELNVIRSNCISYIHGHACGGTNPALVEAMFLRIPIFAHGNVFNKETTNYSALYFNEANHLKLLLKNTPIKKLKKVGNQMYSIANKKYKWKQIISKYEKIFNI